MVGAFWQPRSVIIDPLVLNTLDDANYRAGMAEVIKYGVIMDEEFFQFLESSVEKINARDPKTLTKIIAQSCRCKAQVVEEDEQETTGRRVILNYGHTYGHARLRKISAWTGNRDRHDLRRASGQTIGHGRSSFLRPPNEIVS